VADRDRRVLRRAAVAGGGAWALLSAALLLGALATRAGVRGVLLALTFGLTVGALVAAAWLVLAAVLDVVAGHPPGAGRLAWTVGVALFALASPVFVVAAGSS
jgi:hypothetical protein